MAIIECPECHKEVSDRAVRCPHCGWPIRQAAAPPPRPKAKDVFRPSRPVKVKARPLYLAIAAVVLILGGVFLYHSGLLNIQEQEKSFTNDIGMEFLLIPAGSFMMGSNPNFEEADYDETPQHEVIISKPFYLGVYEVTQEQWEAVMGDNPSVFQGANNPVEHVSWDDVQTFIKILNQNENRGQYRLPTEAEWEYAARAGTDMAYFFGNDAGELDQYAWWGNNAAGRGTQPRGQKQPNPWGLYDIYGNVWELVEDWYGERYYANSPATDPKGPYSGSYRVIRGGGWRNPADYYRSAVRATFSPSPRDIFVGFRLAFSPGQ